MLREKGRYTYLYIPNVKYFVNINFISAKCCKAKIQTENTFCTPDTHKISGASLLKRAVEFKPDPPVVMVLPHEAEVLLLPGVKLHCIYFQRTSP